MSSLFCIFFLLFIINYPIPIQATSIIHDGQFMVIINPHLSYILCSITAEQNQNFELKLININDVVDNQICIKSSNIDISKNDLFYNKQKHTITKQKKTLNTNSEHLIKLKSISSNIYNFEYQTSYLTISMFINNEIPLSPTKPQIILSKKDKLNFTFINNDYSPFTTSNKYRTDISSSGYYDINDINRIIKLQPKIGKRVLIDGKYGIITNYIISSDTYSITFNDGSFGSYSDLLFNNIHISYSIGTLIDAYWPPDKLKLTNIANVLWPGVITNYSNISDSYTIKYEDGSIYPNIPSIWIKYPQIPCKDDRNDCKVLAKDNQCRLNPAFTMIHCRKSCKVCTTDMDMDMDTDMDAEIDDDIFKYYVISINTDGNNPTGATVDDNDLDHNNLNLYYKTDTLIDRLDEGRSLNAIGEKLMLYGNMSLAEEYFLRSSYLGNNKAKFNLGHIYTIIEKDDLAVLNLYFAAIGGSLEANAALGYRHLYGYGVPKSCQISAEYYQKAGNSLFTSISSAHSPFNPIEQQNIEMIRLIDRNRRDAPVKETDEVIRYYHTHAENGDAQAQIALGQLYYYGLRGFTQNFRAAIRYFEMAAEQNYGEAYGMLGNVYVDGVKDLNINKNITKAIEYYNKAIKIKSVSGYIGMAFLYLEGIPNATIDPVTKQKTVKLIKNETAAFDYFRIAAKKQDVSATFYLGLMYFNGIGIKHKSMKDAFDCFMTASRRGHAQSLYYAGYMHLNGLVTAKSCKMAVELFKMATERTISAKELSVARSNYLNSNYNGAYYLYSKLSIQGYEIAQSNVGWLLKRNLVSKNMLLYKADNFTKYNKTLKEVSRKAAFKYFEWSATQNNADSQRIVGDYYYYDYLDIYNDTIATEEISPTDFNKNQIIQNINRFEEAANYYQMSAENILGEDAQSLFNLGYMHQYGIGRKKDFSMAKRYYDLSKQRALNTNTNGNMPNYILLTLLYAERFIDDINNNKLFITQYIPFWSNYNVNGGNINKTFSYYYNNYIYYYYLHYQNDITFENCALCVLVVILMIILWIRR